MVLAIHLSPPTESEPVAEAMEKGQLPIDLVVVSGDDHGCSNPMQRAGDKCVDQNLSG